MCVRTGRLVSIFPHCDSLYIHVLMAAGIFYLKVGIASVCFYLIPFQTYIDCLSIFYLKVGFALWYVSNSYLLKHTSVCFYLISFQTYIDCLSIFYLEVGFALWYVF